MNELDIKENILSVVTATEIVPMAVDSKLPLQEYRKIPLSQVATLGTGLKPLAEAVRQITNSGQGTSGVYRVTIPSGTHLAQFKGSKDFLGTALSNNTNLIANQAHLTPVGFNPAMFCVLAVMASLEKSLNDIHEAQQEMMGYIVQKDKSALKGDLDFMTDVFNNYKNNLDDDKYKTANHLKVLDIRQESARRIDFYREQIKKRIAKRKNFHGDKDINKFINEIQDEFTDYRLSLYLYSFAYFLEVLLQENYVTAYLNTITEKIKNLSVNYQELYTNVYGAIEEGAKASLQSKMFNGLSAVSTASGEVIAKLPLISRSQLDENLIKTGKKLSNTADRHEKTALKRFAECKVCGSQLFIEQIENISKVYNNQLTILFDDKNIYLEENT